MACQPKCHAALRFLPPDAIQFSTFCKIDPLLWYNNEMEWGRHTDLSTLAGHLGHGAPALLVHCDSWGAMFAVSVKDWGILVKVLRTGEASGKQWDQGSVEGWEIKLLPCQQHEVSPHNLHFKIWAWSHEPKIPALRRWRHVDPWGSLNSHLHDSMAPSH